MIETYESAVDSTERFKAVFERNSDAAYLYLLDLQMTEGNELISTFDLSTTNQMFPGHAVSVRWCGDVAVVGLFFASVLAASFDFRSGVPAGRYVGTEEDHWFSSKLMASGQQ